MWHIPGDTDIKQQNKKQKELSLGIRVRRAQSLKRKPCRLSRGDALVTPPFPWGASARSRADFVWSQSQSPLLLSARERTIPVYFP